MKRRSFLKSGAAGAASIYLTACGQLKNPSVTIAPNGYFMSVQGPQPSSSMGFTLTHEHLFADLRSYPEQLNKPLKLNDDEIIATVLPHLQEIKKLGCKTFIDCTAVGLGRNPGLLKALAKVSGMQIVTTTGAYLSNDSKFKPDYFDQMNSDELAKKWIDEWQNGIEGTGIKPGMIKIGVSGGPLSEDEQKLVTAAITTHKASGMIIGCHIGPWREVKAGFNGESAIVQMKLLKSAGVSPDRWIWIHTQNEVNFDLHKQAMVNGAWISYDGFRTEQTEHYVELIARVKKEGHLNNLLISQDAGWYTAGEPGGGKFNSFAPLITHLIPALNNSGFSTDDISLIFNHNPAEAFKIKV